MNTEQKRKTTQATAGLAGFALGAVTGAAIAALSDEKTRKQVSQKAAQMGDQAKQTYRHTTSKLRQAWQQAEPNVRQAGQRVRQGVNRTTQNVEEEVSEAAQKGGEVTYDLTKKSSDHPENQGHA